MPLYDGIEATRRLLARGFAGRVVVLTTFGLDDYVLGALRAGASGFLLKESPAEEILHAIHVVAGGDALIAPTVTRAVIDELGRRPVRADLTARLDTLTSREREVLDLQSMRASTRSRDPQSLSGACPTGDSLRAPRTKNPLSRETWSRDTAAANTPVCRSNDGPLELPFNDSERAGCRRIGIDGQHLPPGCAVDARSVIAVRGEDVLEDGLHLGVVQRPWVRIVREFVEDVADYDADVGHRLGLASPVEHEPVVEML